MPPDIKAADLEAHLAGTVLRWLGDQGLIQMEEFVTPWGVADVLGLQFNLNRVQQRILAGHLEAIGDVHAMQLLLSLPANGKPKRISDLARKFEPLLGPSLFARAVRNLVRKKFVVKDSSSALIRCVEWIPYHERLVAIELKLRRVDEALAQARRHKAITSETYVGLPAIVAERVAFTEKRAAFEASGVGLLSVQDGKCEILISPNLAMDSVIEEQELCAAEACWRKVLQTVQH